MSAASFQSSKIWFLPMDTWDCALSYLQTKDQANVRVCRRLNKIVRGVWSHMGPPSCPTLPDDQIDRRIFGRLSDLSFFPPSRDTEGMVWSSKFSPDGKQIAILSSEIPEVAGTVRAWRRTVLRIWDTETKRLVDAFEEDKYLKFRTILFQQSEKRWLLSAVSSNEQTHILDVKTKQPLLEFQPVPGFGVLTQFSPDGELIANLVRDQVFEIWDVQKGARLYEIPADLNLITFSTDSRFITTPSEGTKMIVIRDARTGNPVAELPLHRHSDYIEPQLFPYTSQGGSSRDALLMVTVREPEQTFIDVLDVIDVLHVKAKNHLYTKELPKDCEITFSPDGAWIAILSGKLPSEERIFRDRDLTVLDAKTGKTCFFLPGREEGVCCAPACHFLQIYKGKTLLITAEKQTPRDNHYQLVVRDIQSQKEHRLQVPRTLNTIFSVNFDWLFSCSPDGLRVSCSIPSLAVACVLSQQSPLQELRSVLQRDGSLDREKLEQLPEFAKNQYCERLYRIVCPPPQPLSEINPVLQGKQLFLLPSTTEKQRREALYSCIAILEGTHVEAVRNSMEPVEAVRNSMEPVEAVRNSMEPNVLQKLFNLISRIIAAVIAFFRMSPRPPVVDPFSSA